MTNLPEKLNHLERVAELHLRSYKPTEIARELGISPAQAKAYIEDYRAVVQQKINNDPDFLDRIAENTIEALERMDGIVKESWSVYETAKNNDMINQQINLLKLHGGFEQQRANLLQLMGAKMDSGMMARMNRAERVNEIVSRVIKEVVGECPRCKVEVMTKLAEAFDLMNKHEEGLEMRQEAGVTDVIEVELVEEETFDTTAMMADVVSDD